MKYYRRHLPHYQTSEEAIFITMRLSNSLPHGSIESLHSEFETIKKSLPDSDENRYLALRKYFQKFDQLLDERTDGNMFLSDDRIASIVQEALHFRDGKEYELIAYCIMPNHVHFVIRMNMEGGGLETVLQSLKTNIALRANKILRRTGAFWQHESYDHVVRNQKEFERVIRYTLNNPVKAGLVGDVEEWKWSYYKQD